MKFKKFSGVVGLMTVVSLALAGCGASSSEAVNTKDDGKLITVDVFDSRANYQGIQKGWAAKIFKDKFNVKLNIIAPNVAGGGDTLFDTRSAAGNLGDIVITTTGGGRMKKLVKAGLISDMTPYLKGMDNIKKFKKSSEALAKIAGKNGVWGLGMGVSTSSPTKPSEGVEPQDEPYIRWDYYREAGYPEIKDMDQFLDVLKQMQDIARKDQKDNKVYAISMFKDWDGSGMAFVQHMAAWFGYANQGSAFLKADGTDEQTVLTKDGIYQKILAWLHKAQTMGLVDPDSSSQNWDKLHDKVTNGKVLLSPFSFLGKPSFNSGERKAKGVGFALAPLQTMRPYSQGFINEGDLSYFIGIGSKAKNKQRLVKIINWLYSPEGVYASSNGTTACPKGMCWEMKDGQPVLSEFGEKVQFASEGVEVPAQWGGGVYADGICALNFPTIAPNDIDPETKQTYNSFLWPSELKKTNPLLSDWSKHMDGAKTEFEYLNKHKMVMVQAGVPYSAPEENSAQSARRTQINSAVVAASWKAALANSQSDFDKEIKEMTTKADGFGFKDIQKFDYAAINEHMAMSKKVAEAAK